MEKITESSSNYDGLDQMSTADLLVNINREDQKVALAVQEILPQIENFIENCLPRMQKGGRLFYMGAGTSGRLGVVDASECPPTFGVAQNVVVGIIAGGDAAIRKAVENAEDDDKQGWLDLKANNITNLDSVIGIAASGTTPYVLGALEKCKENGILTGGITCNPGSPLSIVPEFPMVPVVGPEFVTGSTRMKSGTAQKLVLNMISTSLMIKLGHVKGNRMVDMQLSNDKLVDRGARMIQTSLDCTYEVARELLLKHGSVRNAIDAQN
jgi:N-acetylmuramic acid 6-phosphate etherase|tara:strand:- start:7704 stop:8507 length:804 start_codon:yes stop_codon:yes gene_type:complete